MKKEKYLKNIVVRLDLPFVLRVQDSTTEDIPKGYEQYIFEVNGYPVMIRLKKQVRDIGGAFFAIEDKFGKLTYSEIQVWFDKVFINKFKIELNYRPLTDLIKSEALICINKFLNSYREATGFHWIREINDTDLTRVSFIGRLSDETEDTYTHAGFGGCFGTGIAIGSNITDKQDSILRKRLLSDEGFDELQQLIFTCVDLLERQSYWSSVLTIEMFFEAKIARMLRNNFIKEEITQKELEKRFEQDNGEPRSITSLIKEYMKNFVNTDEYKKWENHARNIRNEVAHGKQISVSRDEALKAIVSVRNFLIKIKDDFPDTVKNNINLSTYFNL